MLIVSLSAVPVEPMNGKNLYIDQVMMELQVELARRDKEKFEAFASTLCELADMLAEQTCEDCGGLHPRTLN